VALRRRLSPGLPLSHTPEEACDPAVLILQPSPEFGEVISPHIADEQSDEASRLPAYSSRPAAALAYRRSISGTPFGERCASAVQFRCYYLAFANPCRQRRGPCCSFN